MNSCPNCGSDEVELMESMPGGYDIDGDEGGNVYQCHDCGHWYNY